MIKKISSRSNFKLIEIKGHTFEIEIPQGEDGESIGLMYRKDIPENSGMIFTRPTAGFWMRNTFVPLTIAFINGNKIVDIQDMEPLSEIAHICNVPFDKAIEFKQGVLQRLGVNIGDEINIL